MRISTEERMAHTWSPNRRQGIEIVARQIGPLAEMARGWLDGLDGVDPGCTRVGYEAGWLIGAETSENLS